MRIKRVAPRRRTQRSPDPARFVLEECERRFLMAASVAEGALAPSGLWANPKSATQVELQWLDRSTSETHFIIDRSTNNGKFVRVGSVAANAQQFTDRTATNSDLSRYRIKAVVGESGPNSQWSSIANTSSLSPAALVIADFTITAQSSFALQLRWRDTTLNETAFTIDRSTDGVKYRRLTSASANTTTWTDGALTRGKRYYYRVRPVVSGQSTPWTTADAKTPVYDSAILQRALDEIHTTGGILQLSAGTYYLDKALALEGISDFEIRGNNTTLQTAGGVTTDLWLGDVMRMINCERFSITGIRFDGNAADRDPGDDAVTLRLVGSEDFEIRNCTFVNSPATQMSIAAAETPTGFRRSARGLVTGCTFDESGGNAISVLNARGLTIERNVFKNLDGLHPAAGIDIEPNVEDGPGSTGDITIRLNTFDRCKFGVLAPLTGRQPFNVTVDSNSFTRCWFAINVAGNNHQVLNNQIDHPSASNGGYRIALAVMGTAGRIDNNDVKGPDIGIAIYCEGSKHVIEDNTIEGFGVNYSVIQTATGTGGNIVRDNVLYRRTSLNWKPYVVHSTDAVYRNQILSL